MVGQGIGTELGTAENFHTEEGHDCILGMVIHSSGQDKFKGSVATRGRLEAKKQNQEMIARVLLGGDKDPDLYVEEIYERFPFYWDSSH